MTQTHHLSMNYIPPLELLKVAFPGFKTMLFDMDGTLFDTEKYHTLALQSIGREQKIVPPFSPDELHQLMMGKADHLLFDLIKDWPGFPPHWDITAFVNEKNRHLIKILDGIDGSAFFSPELNQLIIDAKNDGIQVGLVTSSEKVITFHLLKISKLDQFFHYVLTRDDSLKVKPDPWPYLTAIQTLGASPETTLIFEDSHVGLEAAHGSGAHIIKAEWY